MKLGIEKPDLNFNLLNKENNKLDKKETRELLDQKI